MAHILIFIKLTVSQASDFLFMLGTVITVEHLEQIKRVCHFPSKLKKKKNTHEKKIPHIWHGLTDPHVLSVNYADDWCLFKTNMPGEREVKHQLTISL